ncbi:MAG: DoxX family protein [Planctomycetales bacterium]
MSDSLSKCCAPLGRLLLSMIFVMSGAMKLAQWDQTAQQMTKEGMLAVPFFLAAAAAVEICGGLSVLLGWQARYGALLLALFLVPVTAIFHDFWTYQEPERLNQMMHFSKNATIIGGLLMVAALGAGPVSLDARAARRVGMRE